MRWGHFINYSVDKHEVIHTYSRHLVFVSHNSRRAMLVGVHVKCWENTVTFQRWHHHIQFCGNLLSSADWWNKTSQARYRTSRQEKMSHKNPKSTHVSRQSQTSFYVVYESSASNTTRGDAPRTVFIESNDTVLIKLIPINENNINGANITRYAGIATAQYLQKDAYITVVMVTFLLAVWPPIISCFGNLPVGG